MKKLCKQGEDHIVWKQVEDTAQSICYPYADCYNVNYKPDAVRIGTANALEFISILWQQLSCVFNLFPYYLIPTLFA